MATQPTEVTRWCVDDQDSDGVPLKVIPPAPLIQSGLLRGQPFPRIWLNYYLNNLAENLNFLTTEVNKVGAVLSYIDGTEPDFANDFEGTWVSIGSQTIGSDTVQYYKRVA